MPSVTESSASALGKQGEILFGRATDSLGTVKALNKRGYFDYYCPCLAVFPL